MTSFWSIVVTIITLGSIAGCVALLWWCAKNNTGVKEGESMGHTFDGIEELNNPLPKWWSWMFIFTIVFSIVYLILFPGLGNFKGVLNWQSSHQGVRSLEESRQLSAASEGLNQYDLEIARADEHFGPIFNAFAQRPIHELAYDPDARKVGRRLFLQNCAQCHGADARGGKGFPNLTDNDWLYGGTPEHIKTTLIAGRVAAMPSWQQALGDDGIREVVSYVLSLNGRRGLDVKEVAAGKAKFVVCAACHGADGKGNIALGAPNLTNNTWLYGGSRKAVTETLVNGRNGVMPAFNDILGEDKIHLLSAYVYSLSHPEE